jgi:SCY1-like protein 1
VCPSLIDKEKAVRDQAMKAMEIYLTRVKKYASTMPDNTPSSASGSQVGTPRVGTPSQNAESSWAGWAISSFTNKLGAASGSIEPSAAAAPIGNTHRPAASSRATSAPPAATTTLSPSPRVFPNNSTSLHRQVLSPSASARTSLSASREEQLNDNDLFAWNDAFEDDDQNEEQEDKDPFGEIVSPPPESEVSSVAGNFDTGASESAKPKTTTTKIAANPYASNAEPDFGAWLQEQEIKKKGKLGNAGKPLPKGLGKPAVSSKKSSGTGDVGVGTSKKPETKKKVIDTSVKDDGGEDEWAAWD